MKQKQKVDMVIALCLVFIGVLLLVLPIMGITNIYHLMIFIFSSYSLLNLLQFILTRTSKDYESIYSAIISLVTLLMCFIFDPTSQTRILALILMTWISFMSLAKLKKIDYYHDRNDRMWKIRVFNLSFFLLTGILTSINLAYSSDVQVLVIGFFMLIHGILELFDPIVKTLIAHS